MSEVLTLAERLDSAAAPGLAESLRERLGQDLVVDAAPVRQIGALCLQVLLSAAQSWAADGKSLRITNLKDAARAQLNLFGVTQDQFAGALK